MRQIAGCSEAGQRPRTLEEHYETSDSDLSYTFPHSQVPCATWEGLEACCMARAHDTVNVTRAARNGAPVTHQAGIREDARRASRKCNLNVNPNIERTGYASRRRQRGRASRRHCRRRPEGTPSTLRRWARRRAWCCCAASGATPPSTCLQSVTLVVAVLRVCL